MKLLIKIIRFAAFILLSCVASFIITIGALVFNLTITDALAWRSFSPPDNSFRVQAPNRPDFDWLKESNTSAYTFWTVPGRTLLSVMEQVAEQHNSFDDCNANLQALSAQMRACQPGRVVHDRILATRPPPARELLIELDDGNIYRLESFYHGGHMFAITTLGPPVDIAKAERFRSSFEPLTIPEAGFCAPSHNSR